MAGFAYPATAGRVGRTWNQIVTGLGLSSQLAHCIDVGDPASANLGNNYQLTDVVTGIVWSGSAASATTQIVGKSGQLGEEYMAFVSDWIECSSNSAFFNSLQFPTANWTLMVYGHYQPNYSGSGQSPLFGNTFTGAGINWDVYEFSGTSQHQWSVTISTSGGGGFFFDSGGSGQGVPTVFDGGIYPHLQWYCMTMDQTNKLLSYHTGTQSVSIPCDLTGMTTADANANACWFADSDGFPGPGPTKLAAALGFNIPLTRAQFMSIVAGSVASSSFTTRGAFP